MKLLLDRRRDRRLAAALEPYIDEEYFSRSGLSPASCGFSAAEHYVKSGAALGFQPNSYFDAVWYISKNPDVPSRPLDALLHYLRFGWREGRNPSRFFDVESYLSHHKDVREAAIDPLKHYITVGRREGRRIFSTDEAQEQRRDELNQDNDPALGSSFQLGLNDLGLVGAVGVFRSMREIMTGSLGCNN